eukprot:SAG11_NODE_1540_length_4722_cov_2.812243_2_plen_146_part_00
MGNTCSCDTEASADAPKYLLVRHRDIGQRPEIEAARLARLRDELNGLKMRALQRRAAKLGVDDDALDAAEEKSAVIELIMAKEAGAGTPRVTTESDDAKTDSRASGAPDSLGSHSGPAHSTGAEADSMDNIFARWKQQGLHVMFS